MDQTVALRRELEERRRAEEKLQKAYSSLRNAHQELQNTQLQLIQAAKLESVGQLAAGVAHEVKNPLAVILTGLRCLSDRVGTDENTIQLLEDMKDAVTRADTVVAGLLDFSRPGKLEKQVECLNSIIDRSLLFVKHDLARCHVQVEKDLQADLPPLDLDVNKIQQVFVILFTNAIHAMPEGGMLSVRSCFSRRPGGAVVKTEIEDTGTGIPADQIEKVFDPFFSTKPTGQGTGLGLSVARQIVNLHDGSLQIRNRKIQGVEVTLTLGLGRRSAH